eukprot:914312-Pelagomonas_calceolata.AAC.1
MKLIPAPSSTTPDFQLPLCKFFTPSVWTIIVHNTHASHLKAHGRQCFVALTPSAQAKGLVAKHTAACTCSQLDILGATSLHTKPASAALSSA